MRGPKTHFGKYALRTFLAASTLIIGTHMSSALMTIYEKQHPDSTRAEFYEETGVHLTGNLESLDEKEDRVSELTRIVQSFPNLPKEHISHIHINPTIWWKNPLIDQLYEQVNGVTGSYNKWSEGLTLRPGWSAGVVIHELCHAKYKEVLEEHKDFDKKWMAIVGEDAYDNVDTAQHVTAYSTKNLAEDVAETCRVAIIPQAGELGEVFHSKHDRSILQEKVRYLAQTELIPPEVEEFAAVDWAYVHRDKQTATLANNFLDTHPDSFYSRFAKQINNKK